MFKSYHNIKPCKHFIAVIYCIDYREDINYRFSFWGGNILPFSFFVRAPMLSTLKRKLLLQLLLCWGWFLDAHAVAVLCLLLSRVKEQSSVLLVLCAFWGVKHWDLLVVALILCNGLSIEFNTWKIVYNESKVILFILCFYGWKISLNHPTRKKWERSEKDVKIS